MSAGGFWRRSRARPEYEEASTLTATDRCDRCGARAYETRRLTRTAA